MQPRNAALPHMLIGNALYSRKPPFNQKDQRSGGQGHGHSTWQKRVGYMYIRYGMRPQPRNVGSNHGECIGGSFEMHEPQCASMSLT
jgi:hypothetical protein